MAVTQVYQSDTRTMAKVKALLERVDITLDEHLDYTCAVFDEEGEPIATGSAFGPTLRCFAVDPAHQGEGLLNEVITHLMEDRLTKGYFHLFVYTKPGSAKFFKDLGFCEIAEVPGFLVFLENRRNGFAGYLKQLAAKKQPGQAAAIVMNANPFTLGHRYLIETAARENDVVHLFMLSENAGPIPAKVRHRLVREGVADLPNVICHETGEYLISSATFPGYFLKSEEKILRTQARLDTALFVQIAKTLDVTARYVGHEPHSLVTALYNDVLSEALPAQGIQCRIIPRKHLPDGRVISASAVRQAVHDGRLEEAADMLPETTLNFFRSPEAAPIIAAIRREKDVVHY
ncbi:MAG: [Oscillospiraceae bacterium]|nr:[citrate (pro-3S)-lyase] ligase [Oscillospiraceae bacterium]